MKRTKESCYLCFNIEDPEEELKFLSILEKLKIPYFGNLDDRLCIEFADYYMAYFLANHQGETGQLFLSKIRKYSQNSTPANETGTGVITEYHEREVTRCVWQDPESTEQEVVVKSYEHLPLSCFVPIINDKGWYSFSISSVSSTTISIINTDCICISGGSYSNLCNYYRSFSDIHKSDFNSDSGLILEILIMRGICSPE